MFVEIDEENTPEGAPAIVRGTFKDLEKQGISIENTKRGIPCTELISKEPFKLIWVFEDGHILQEDSSLLNNEHRYVFAGFFNENSVRRFDLCFTS